MSENERNKDKLFNKNENKSQRVPKCAKCRNHGLDIRKKGHKDNCAYNNCQCPKCVLIAERRDVLARLVKLRRINNREEKVEKLLSYRPALNQPSFVAEIDQINNPTIQINDQTNNPTIQTNDQTNNPTIQIKNEENEEKKENNYCILHKKP